MEGLNCKVCATRPGRAVHGKVTEASSYNCNIDLTVGSSVCSMFCIQNLPVAPRVYFKIFFFSVMGSKTVFAFSGHATLIKAVVTWYSVIIHDQCFCTASSIAVEKVPPLGAV